MAHETLKLMSPSISHEGKIPRKYTGDGQGAQKDISPPLQWHGVPEDTKSLALVVQDIDAPDPDGPIVPWTHWVVVNISPSLKGLPEGFSGKEEEVGGDYADIKEGTNDWKVPRWRGPKPPPSGHRYEFKLYALDDHLHLGNKVTKEKLLDSIGGKVLAEAELVATF
ncbi:UPF0098 protein [Cinnamomum micranthum f. kanehirae]|uniref:UPF0098 protein n=1 Tax=Cinnamomum micranthum f. kanehirae TaxID=337451 RepID=A0A3S3MFH8_9MAGN|nr:UPF0098 protein [Cinnamomum micranthum f. kanehirae]RWR78894.1 UPF0098 protein [Cinnamomum micranthum f. kanehirae]